MKLKRLLTLVEKERKQMLRESSNIAIGIILPVVMLLIFGYGMSMDVKNIRLVIVALEDFFLDGTAADDFELKVLPFNSTRIQTENGEQVMEWPLWKEYFRSNVRQLGNKKLLALLNYHADRTAYVRIRLPDPGDERIGAEYISGRTIIVPAGKKEFIVAVPPRDARMIVFGDPVPADFTPSPGQDELRAAFEREKAEFNSKSGSAPVQPWKDKDFEFSYSDINGDGTPEVVIRNRKLSLTIDPAGGRIVRVEFEGTKLFVKDKLTGFLAEPRLWLPKEMRRNMMFGKTAFVSVKRQDGRLAAEQLMTDNPLHLELRRIYTLKPGSAAVEIETAYRNTSKMPLTLVPWTRSVFSTPGPAGKPELFGTIGGTESRLPLVQGCNKATLTKQENAAAATRPCNAVFALDSPVVRQLFPSDGLLLRYRPDPADAAAYYFDSSVGTTTVERHDNSLTLAPDETKTVIDVYEFGRAEK